MANSTAISVPRTDTRRVHAAVALALALLCLPPLAAPARAQTVPMEAVVAVVDDDIVLASEYRSRTKQVTQNLARPKVEMPPQEVLARQVLDRLILERIQLQMAERAGVQISDAQLNEAIGTMAQQNGLTLEQFKTSLETQGESYNALREQVRQEMTLQRVQQGNVRSRVQVTEQEVTDFLASEEGQKRTSAVYHIAHLLLPLSEQATVEDEKKARAYVQSLRTGLLEGDTFERFIRNPDKSQYPFTGGDLGWRPAADLPGIFADAVPKLEVHGLSEPVRSPSGLHLVKLLEKRGGSGQIMQQTKARHILLKPSEIRSPEQTHELATTLRARAGGRGLRRAGQEILPGHRLAGRGRRTRLGEPRPNGARVRAGHDADGQRRAERALREQLRLAHPAGRGPSHAGLERGNAPQRGPEHPLRAEVRGRAGHLVAEDTR